MELRNGKKTMEHICTTNNDWWLKYTKEHCMNYLHDGEMFNKNIYGKYSIDEWLTIILPNIFENEKIVRHHAKKL